MQALSRDVELCAFDGCSSQTRNFPINPQGDLKMEPNFDQQTVAMGASSMQVDDSMKSRILERIKAQMAHDSIDLGETGSPIPPIYLKAPDDWP